MASDCTDIPFTVRFDGNEKIFATKELSFNDNDLNNNNRIQRRNSRLFTVSSLSREHVGLRSSGQGAIVCKSCATHQALIECNTSCYVPRGTKEQLSY